ncbi:MAG: class II aldolase/adducin family protein [Elusimicrobiota bacterium]|nr:class II aldolase/adducin family protein [Elusimicrobiota bacterium]
MYEEFIKIGQRLLQEGLTHSTAGNMSKRQGDAIYITRHGSQLGELSVDSIVKVNLYDDRKDTEASVEVKIHRAIYKYSPEILAIIHAHPTYSIVLSFDYDKIVPLDVEGQFYLPQVPVLYWCADTIGSECVEENLPKIIVENKVAVIRGHGAFSAGKTLRECFNYLSVLESACKIIYLKELLRKS